MGKINNNFLLDTNTLIYFFNGLVEDEEIYTLNDEIAKKTIKNRQLHKIKIPDAIIAATAQIYGFKLVTNNVKDFENLNLEIISMKLNIQ